MNHTRDLSRVRRVLRRRGEDAKRGRNECKRCRTNLINGDIDATALFSPLRINTTGSIFSFPLIEKPSFPLALLYFSFYCDLLFASYIAFLRENLSFFLSRDSLSVTRTLSFSLSRMRAFLGGEGARPGAAVSKYDTGIGYKETINHTQARVNGTRPLWEPLSGRFLRGYLDGQIEEERERGSANIAKSHQSCNIIQIQIRRIFIISSALLSTNFPFRNREENSRGRANL